MIATSTATERRFTGLPETIGVSPKVMPLYAAMALTASASIAMGHVRITAACSVGTEAAKDRREHPGNRRRPLAAGIAANSLARRAEAQGAPLPIETIVVRYNNGPKAQRERERSPTARCQSTIRMSEEELYGSQVARFLVNLSRLGAAHRVRAVRRTIETGALNRSMDDARVLACREVRLLPENGSGTGADPLSH
jgi:hypothetical protein